MASQSQLVSKSTVFPHHKSTMPDLKLSVSDLPMLSCHYIQKGCLFTTPPFPFPHLLSLLKRTLSHTLTLFPPLAGRLTTYAAGYVYVACNDAGVDFIHVDGSHMHVRDLLGSPGDDIPDVVKTCFAYDYVLNYDGHFRPLIAVQVTELADGVFIGCAANHAVVDGTSFWNFFNTFADLSKGMNSVQRTLDFSRDSVLVSPAVLRLPEGGPEAFSADAPVRERTFSFSRASILKLKAKVNNGGELMGNDTLNLTPLTIRPINEMSHTDRTAEISSFQSLCALLWRAITRARKLPASKTTTFRTAINCRHRLEPKLEPLYFGNAIQSILTYALAGELLAKDLRWCAEQLSKTVVAHGNAAVRKYVEDWERQPRCFSLGNPDGFRCMIMISGGGDPLLFGAGGLISLMGRFRHFRVVKGAGQFI